MKKLAALAIVAAMIVPTAAFAVTGTIQATANVLTPLSVSTDLRALDFGDVFPGVNKAVTTSGATSGLWQIAGAANAEVQMTFTLPANLSDGTNNLPISFSAVDAAYNQANVIGGAIAFDPAAGYTDRLEVAAGDGFVWLGGTVAPAPAQPAGAYAATVSLDVVYTGN